MGDSRSSAAVKNVASGVFFLIGEKESRSVIEKGVEWEYENDNGKETLQTTGPLRHGILIMVQSEKEESTIEFCSAYTFTHTCFGILMNCTSKPSHCVKWCHHLLI